MRANLLVLAGLSRVSGVPAAVAAPGPMDFLQGLYACYAERADASFDSLDNPAAWYSPGLIKLTHADEVAAGGDEGKLEMDPVCDGQDHGDFKVVIVSLVQLQAGWRIDDLGSAGMPSLRALLTTPE